MVYHRQAFESYEPCKYKWNLFCGDIGPGKVFILRIIMIQVFPHIFVLSVIDVKDFTKH